MLFGNKIEAANQRIAALTALLAAAGVPLAEGAELPTVASVAATLETNRSAAVAEALKPVHAAHAQIQHTALAYAAGLEAAGVKVADFKPADFTRAEGAAPAALTPAAAAVQAAVETAIAAKAAKQVAASGHAAALEVPPGEGTAEPTSAELFAQFNALTDSRARAAFYAKHQTKLLR